MAKLNKSILIAAPAEKIFAYMNDPKNLTEIWPSMQEIKVSPTAG
jgi:carbon monoxide dehydrogenase subunit G